MWSRMQIKKQESKSEKFGLSVHEYFNAAVSNTLKVYASFPEQPERPWTGNLEKVKTLSLLQFNSKEKTFMSLSLKS